MIEQTLAELVREIESDYTSGTETTISEYVQFDLYENINKIDAYLNSKHISGETDSKGREKPFFNIVTSAVNIYYRATDIDRKNITIRATKLSNKITSFLATVLLGEWMKRENFGVFLNDWGRTLARFGSAISKFIEKDGKLFAEVIPWNRVIIDAIEFEGNPVIEKLWMTPAQLRNNKNYDQDYVEELIDKAKGVRELLGGEKKDNKDNYIPVYEVHGEFPLSYLTDKESDEDTYVQQMHVLCFVSSKDDVGKTTFEDFTLYSGKEAKNPYMITHLIKEDGRSQSIGAVENLFQAQWMINHSQKQIKDQLDLASKLIFQTSDGNFAGRNALNSIESGDILIHASNMPLTQVANNSHDITSLQSFSEQWRMAGMQINGINEAMVQAPKSGTAWRQTEAVLQEAHSLFELMTENKGLAIEDMLRNYVIPHLKKKMDTSEEISSILTEQQINQIDKLYVPNEAIRRTNNKIKRKVLSTTLEDIKSGNLFDSSTQPGMIAEEETRLQNDMTSMGNQRFIKPSDISTKTWKEVLKDVEWLVDVDVTGEGKDTQSAMQTLSTLLQTLVAKQGQPFTPAEQVVVNKILTLTGEVNPMEINQMPQQTSVAPAPVPQLAPTA